MCRWLKLIAETLQELHTRKHGSRQLHPFCGISYVSLLVRASNQGRFNLSENAAAVVAVVTAVAGALAFPLTAEEAAICSSKVGIAHLLRAKASPTDDVAGHQ